MEVVVMEGVLEVCRRANSTSSRDWKPRLFILRRYDDTLYPTLDYYKDTKKRWQKQTPMGGVILSPSLVVSIAHSCDYKFPFLVTTKAKGAGLLLAASSVDMMTKWIYHIQTQRKLEKPSRDCLVFPVQPQSSQDTRLIGARGECRLAVTSSNHLICALYPSQEVVVVWPFSSLRRYWAKDSVFGIEVGRRSPRGEGTYEFSTVQDEDIYRALHRFIRRLNRASVSSESGGEIDVRPPAEIPSGDNETPVATSNSEEEEEEGEEEEGGLGRYVGAAEHPVTVSRTKQTDASLGYHLESPPLPPKSRVMRKSSGKLHTTPPGQVNPETSVSDAKPLDMNVSTTSPAYLHRVRTGSNHRWLHESIEEKRRSQTASSIAGEPLPPPPPPPQLVEGVGPGLQTEDTYAHTVHVVPSSFQPAPVGAASLYNALVHTQDPGLRHKPRPGSKDDTELYDVAFPPDRHRPRPMVTTGDGEPQYGTAYAKDTRSNGFGQMPLAKLPLSPQGVNGAKPASPPRLERLKEEPDGPTPMFRSRVGSDGLTVNPLYGSQENLLEQIAALEALEGSTEVMANPVYSGVSLTGTNQATPPNHYQTPQNQAPLQDQAPSLVPQPQNQAPSLVPQPQLSRQQQAPATVPHPQAHVPADKSVPNIPPRPPPPQTDTPQSSPELTTKTGTLPNTNTTSPKTDGTPPNTDTTSDRSPLKTEGTPPKTDSTLSKADGSPPKTDRTPPNTDSASSKTDGSPPNTSTTSLNTTSTPPNTSTTKVPSRPAPAVPQKPRASPQKDTLPVPSAAPETGSHSGSDKPAVESSAEGQTEEARASASGSVKGYSKVDPSRRSVKKEVVEPAETETGEESAPPPIPARNYSNSECDS